MSLKAASFLRRLIGRRPDPQPPGELWPFAGIFARSGEPDLRFLVEETALRPDARILDVGCGLGRLAWPLRPYLDDRGCYEGFDVRRKAIAWARRHVARRDPRIRFRHVDVFNRQYNPGGSIGSLAFRFPYRDASFDLVVLFSVFTHLPVDDVRRYLGEVARVLVPEGRCVASFWLLDRPATLRLTHATFAFSHTIPGRGGAYFVADPIVPEKAVAYPEALVRSLYEEAGLRILEPIRYGERGERSGQDRIVSRKP